MAMVSRLLLGLCLTCIFCGLSKAIPPDPDLCFFWDQAIYSKGSCFKLFNDNEGMSQEDAEEACEDHTTDGRLAAIIDQQQLKDLLNLTASNGLDAWIGPEYDTALKFFVNPSSTTSLFNTIQDFWSPEHPTQVNSDACVAIAADGRLETFDCEEDLLSAYICQQRVDDACEILLPESHYFHRHCFRYMGQRRNWTTAKDTCSAMNALLVELTDPYILDYVKEMGQNYPGSEWIGAHAANSNMSSMKWWKSGIPVSLESEYWGSPSDPYQEKHRYLLQDEANNNLWKTREPAELHTFICFVEHGNPCEYIYPGSVYTDGQCVKLHTVPKTWKDAGTVCKKEGTAVLADLSTVFIFHTVNQLAKTLPSPTDVFIGLSDTAKEGTFVWAASKTIVTSPEWAHLEPKFTTMNTDYVAIKATSFEWIVLDDKETRPFVCQKAFKPSYLRKYLIAIPDLPKVVADDDSPAYLQVVTTIASHKVYVQADATSPETSMIYFRFYVMRDQPYKLALPRTFYTDTFGISKKRIRLLTSFPVTVTLYYMDNGVKANTLLYPSMYNPKTLSSYVLASAGFSDLEDDDIESQVAIQTVDGGAMEVFVRFPNHRTGKVLLKIHGMELILTGDIHFTLAKYHSALVRLTGHVDGVFVFTTKQATIVVTSRANSPHIPGGFSYVISPTLPTMLVASFYVTFPTIEEDQRFEDIFTIISIGNDNVIIIKGKDSPTTPLSVTFPEFGMVKTVKLPLNGFYTVKGDHPFYLIKHARWIDGEDEKSPCQSPILPKKYWLRHYLLLIAPDPGITRVTLLIIVNIGLETDVLLDNNPLNMSCSFVVGSLLMGCHIDLLLVLTFDLYSPHYLHVKDYAVSFMAYVTVITETAISCRPLAIFPSITLKTNAVSLNTVYTQGNASSTPATTTSLPATPSPIPLITTTGSLTTTSPKTTTTTSTISTTTSTTKNYTTTTAMTKKILNLTEEEQRRILHELKTELKVDARSTSAFKRTKVSITDIRTSSTAIGYVGVGVMVAVFSFIVWSDVFSAMNFMFTRLHDVLTSRMTRHMGHQPTALNGD